MAGGTGPCHGWGDPAIFEITPVVWTALLVLCWHVYAMASAAFQQKQLPQKVFFASYLSLALYVSWYNYPFEHMFSTSLAVYAVFGIIAGLLLYRFGKQHVYVVHAVALASTYIAIGYLLDRQKGRNSCSENPLSDTDLLGLLLEPAIAATIAGVVLAYSAILWGIKKYRHLLGWRSILLCVVLAGLLIALPFMANFFHASRDVSVVLSIIAVVTGVLAVCIATMSVEIWFSGKNLRLHGLGLSLISFLNMMLFVKTTAF